MKAIQNVKYISARVLAKRQHQVLIESFKDGLWRLSWGGDLYNLICDTDSQIKAFVFGDLDEADAAELNRNLDLTGNRHQFKVALGKLINEFSNRTPMVKVKKRETRKDKRISEQLGKIAEAQSKHAEAIKPFWQKGKPSK